MKLEVIIKNNILPLGSVCYVEKEGKNDYEVMYSSYVGTYYHIIPKKYVREYIKPKLKIYHDITCNCYDCRAGTSLKAKE